VKKNSPPTEDQIALLRKLGCQWNPPNEKCALNVIQMILFNSKKFQSSRMEHVKKVYLEEFERILLE